MKAQQKASYKWRCWWQKRILHNNVYNRNANIINSIERFAGILFWGRKVIHFRAFDCQTPSEKWHFHFSYFTMQVFLSRNNLIHVFRNGFFPLSTSNKLLQITAHFCSYCSDKSLKQRSKTLESVDSRSLTFRIAIRTEKSLKATMTLSPRAKPRKICKREFAVNGNTTWNICLVTLQHFPYSFVLCPHKYQPLWLS